MNKISNNSQKRASDSSGQHYSVPSAINVASTEPPERRLPEPLVPISQSSQQTTALIDEFDPLCSAVPDTPPPAYDSVVDNRIPPPLPAKSSPVKASNSIPSLPPSKVLSSPTKFSFDNRIASSTSPEEPLNDIHLLLRVKERPAEKFNSELLEFTEKLKATYLTATSRNSVSNLGLVFSPIIQIDSKQTTRSGKVSNLPDSSMNQATFVVRYHWIVLKKLLSLSANTISKISSSPPQLWWSAKMVCDINSKVELLIENVINTMEIDDKVTYDVISYLFP